MSSAFRKLRMPAACIVFSLLVHLLPVMALRMFGAWNPGAAVSQPAPILVDLSDRGDAVPAAIKPEAEASAVPVSAPASVPLAKSPLPAQAEIGDATPESPLPLPPLRKPDEALSGPATATPQTRVTDVVQPRLRASDFLAGQYEKLTYQISMAGIPIGSAELEAKNEAGTTSITLRVRSNAVTSSFFPVDDVVETKHIDGRFIMTKIRQQEGSFRSDEMFTINLGKGRVSWTDLLQNRSLKMTVPSDQVLDTLSGIYYLRSHQLEVGKTETLQIFDSEIYAEVPVEILRREEVRLANLTKVATLVVRPLQKTAGIFRRTGEVLIWMTDDEHKVPVKIITTIALGRVTAELISAESRLHDDKQVPGVPVASTQVEGTRERPLMHSHAGAWER